MVEVHGHAAISAEAPMDRHLADRWLAHAEGKAKLPKLAGGLWHPYRRQWATEGLASQEKGNLSAEATRPMRRGNRVKSGAGTPNTLGYSPFNCAPRKSFAPWRLTVAGARRLTVAAAATRRLSSRVRKNPGAWVSRRPWRVLKKPAHNYATVRCRTSSRIRTSCSTWSDETIPSTPRGRSDRPLQFAVQESSKDLLRGGPIESNERANKQPEPGHSSVARFTWASPPMPSPRACGWAPRGRSC